MHTNHAPSDGRKAGRPALDPVAGLIAIALGVTIAVYTITISLQAGSPHQADFRVFYGSARLLIEGKSIYEPLPTDYLGSDLSTWDGKYLRGNLNPPIQTVLLAPLGFLGYRSAYVVWALCLLSAGIASAWAVCGHLGHTLPRQRLGTVLILLFSYGTWHSIASGQFGTPLLLALVLGWIWMERGLDDRAGVILGVALSLKLFVGAVVLVLVVQRRWCALAWLAASVLVCSAIGAAVAGPQSYYGYLDILRGVEWLNDGRNVSAMGWAHRVTYDALGLTSTAALERASMAGRLAAAGILTVTALCVSRTRSIEGERAAGLVAGVPAMLLASPLGWIYYSPVLLLPLLWLWEKAEGVSPALSRAIIAVCWLSTVTAALSKDSPWALTTLPFLGVLGLWSASLAQIIRTAPKPLSRLWLWRPRSAVE